MVRAFLIFFWTFCALLLTSGIVVVIMMHDLQLHAFVEKMFCEQASRAGRCRVQATVSHVDLIHGTVLFSHMLVAPLQDELSWFCCADHLKVELSLPSFFSEGRVQMKLFVYGLEVHTQVESKTIALAEHIQEVLRHREVSLPLKMESVYLGPSSLYWYAAGSCLKTVVNGELVTVAHTEFLGLTLLQNLVSYQGHDLIKDMYMQLRHTYDHEQDVHEVTVRGSLAVWDIIHKKWYPGKIKGAYNAQGWSCSYMSDDGLYMIALDNTLTLTIGDTQGALVQATLQKGRYQATLDPRVLMLLPGDSFPAITTPLSFSTHDLSLETPVTFVWEPLELRIPTTSHFIRSLRTQISYSKGCLFLEKMRIESDQGALTSGLSTLCMKQVPDGSGLAFRSIYFPFTFENYFFNIGKDIFAQLSGTFTLMYDAQGRSSLAGITRIKKSSIRNNPATLSLTSAVASPYANRVGAFPPCDLDIKFYSHEPVDINTDMLKAQAHLFFHVRGTLEHPRISGTIDMYKGTFNFPYTSLMIQQGKIFFVDHRTDDPVLEMTATGFVKHYKITMTIEGTAREPRIRFYATPDLPEEQIISLLLSGAPDSPLSLVMPWQRGDLLFSAAPDMEKLLLGSAHDSSSVLDYFKGWLRPFEKVKIIPRFSDQTSRGGIRGALAIEVNDTVSALIQQNFSLTEDVLIEVAYKPIDDLTMRGVRDERGDFGGEIEARFTW